MLAKSDQHVEIAGGSAAQAGLALAGDPELLPVVDPRGDVERKLVVTALATLAAASRAQRIDCLARAATPWARRHVHKASEHRLLDLTHLAAPIAGAAGRDLRAGLRAAALAALARLEPRDADRARAALHRVDELDLDLHAQVGAAHRSPRLASAELATKERLEEIADAEVSETLTVAEHVVALAPLRVGKHLVRLGDRLEALAPIGGLARVGVVLA